MGRPARKSVGADGPRAVPQRVIAPLTRAAVFLVVAVNPGAENVTAVRSLCGDVAALVRSVGFRVPEGSLSCITAFGSEAWDSLFGRPRPAELHRFREIRAGDRHAVSTKGDILFHIRAQRMDLCFDLAAQIIARLGAAVSTVDEVDGFRYFDSRDLIGFVDGTENPKDQGAVDATLIGGEDPTFAAGSYVIVQKYLRAPHGETGGHRRPHEVERHRARRLREALLCAQRPDQDSEGRPGGQDTPGQHALRPRRAA